MSVFHFKHFSIQQKGLAHKVGTDAMVLGALIEVKHAKQAIDIGTGSGVLALMMVQKNPDLEVLAIEIDHLSAQIAKQNFENSNYHSKIQLKEEDFLGFHADVKYDLIVSNPPYFLTNNVNQDERKAKARHAIDLNPEAFFTKAKSLLSEEGSIWIIVPIESLAFYLSAALNNSLFLNVKIEIQGKKGQVNRLVLCFGNNEEICKTKELVIRDEDGNYSSEYVKLTFDFHDRSIG